MPIDCHTSEDEFDRNEDIRVDDAQPQSSRSKGSRSRKVTSAAATATDKTDKTPTSKTPTSKVSAKKRAARKTAHRTAQNRPGTPLDDLFIYGVRGEVFPAGGDRGWDQPMASLMTGRAFDRPEFVTRSVTYPWVTVAA